MHIFYPKKKRTKVQPWLRLFTTHMDTHKTLNFIYWVPFSYYDYQAQQASFFCEKNILIDINV